MICDDMLVGDVYRILRYPARGFAIAEPVPVKVFDAFTVLREAGHSNPAQEF